MAPEDPGGHQAIRSCPLDETKLAALDLHDDIEERAATPYNPFVIPVLVFPDMEPDMAIEKLACHQGVYIIWGIGNLLYELESIVQGRSVSDRMLAHRIAREVDGVTDGLIRLEEIGEAECGDLGPRGVAPATLTLRVGDLSVVRIRAEAIRCHLPAVIVIHGFKLSQKLCHRRGPPGSGPW